MQGVSTTLPAYATKEGVRVGLSEAELQASLDVECLDSDGARTCYADAIPQGIAIVTVFEIDDQGTISRISVGRIID